MAQQNWRAEQDKTLPCASPNQCVTATQTQVITSTWQAQVLQAVSLGDLIDVQKIISVWQKTKSCTQE